jgi:hypothetical protein
MAVKMPKAGGETGVDAPAGMLAIPKASANGSAINPTVKPANISSGQEKGIRRSPHSSKKRGRNKGRRAERDIKSVHRAKNRKYNAASHCPRKALFP